MSTTLPRESLSEYVERLMGNPQPKKLKPKQRYQELRESRKSKRG
jgi:hypothetical protein